MQQPFPGDHSEKRIDRQNGLQACDKLGSPSIPKPRLERYPPKVETLRRFNEGYTLQGVRSMTNQGDDGIPWLQWVNLPPRRSSSNGEELEQGGMGVEGFDDASQWYTESTNCK